MPFEKQIESIGIFENWVRWVKNSRNLVHPGCWLKPDYYFGNIHEWMRKTPYKKYNKFVKLSDETIEVIRELLLKKIEDDIVRQLDKLKLRERQNNQLKKRLINLNGAGARHRVK